MVVGGACAGELERSITSPDFKGEFTVEWEMSIASAGHDGWESCCELMISRSSSPKDAERERAISVVVGCRGKTSVVAS